MDTEPLHPADDREAFRRRQAELAAEAKAAGFENAKRHNARSLINSALKEIREANDGTA